MTYQGAIKQLNDLIENSKSFSEEDDNIWNNDVNALKMAIEALEKQIPKKPSFGADGTPQCSECLWDEFYNKDAMRYCPSCGQAIDWEETE